MHSLTVWQTDKFRCVRDPQKKFERAKKLARKTGKPHIFKHAGSYSIHYANLDTTALKLCFYVRELNGMLNYA